MNDQRIHELMQKQMTVSTLDCLINFKALDALLEVATDQMKFPSWRASNPQRTELVRRAIAAVEAANIEREERCLEFARALGEESRRQIEKRIDDQPTG